MQLIELTDWHGSKALNIHGVKVCSSAGYFLLLDSIGEVCVVVLQSAGNIVLFLKELLN